MDVLSLGMYAAKDVTWNHDYKIWLSTQVSHERISCHFQHTSDKLVVISPDSYNKRILPFDTGVLMRTPKTHIFSTD